ncbi:PQQ-binding-like beta-propeller repeat protein [Candidatus Nanosalina sp. VS9-1]|uniref:outer membrane protein assembly factor BamB family protein n=1 Tax=Candidatus Nanosalina sp. VS9-1 TaxID=3388566 RepID=UPI0039E11801
MLVFVVVFAGLTASIDWPQFQQNSNNTGYSDGVGIKSSDYTSWVFNFGANAVYSGPVVDEDTVYSGSNYGDVGAVWRDNGSERWRVSTGGEIQGAPAITQDKVFAATLNGDGDRGLFSIWKENGSVDFGIQNSELGGDVKSSISLKGEMGYVSLSSGTNDTYAFYQENLSEVWRYSTGVAVASTPAVTEERVVVFDQANNLVVLNRTTGNVNWTLQTSDPGSDNPTRGNSPTVVNNTIYVVTDDGEVSAFDLISGTKEWGPVTPGGGVVGSPAYSNGSLYVTDSSGNIAKFNATDGSYVTGSIPNGARSSPSVADGVLYVGTLDLVTGSGYFYAVDTDTFNVLWEYETGREIAYSSSAVVDNEVYFTSWDSRLYGLEGPEPDTTAPSISEKNLVDRTDFNGALKDGDKVSVYANVTDESDITSVTADLSEFGAGSSVSMTDEVSASFDWDGDGTLESDIYGTNATVDGASTSDGASKTTTITADDSAGNSGTTNTFGSLTVDTVKPVFGQLNISTVSTSEPVFEANFTEETSGLNTSTNVTVTDSTGTVIDGTVGQTNGVTVQNQDKIIFDFSQRADSLSEGTVTVDIEAEDQAGNDADPVSESFIVDTTPPFNMSIISPESQVYLRSEENLTVEYSYNETNPFFTELRFFDQDGNLDAERNFSESSSDPSSSEDIYLDNQSHDFSEGETYDITLFAQDDAGNTNSTTETGLLTIDNTKPVLNESSKVDLQEFDFKVSDNIGLNSSTVQASDFEFKTSGVSGSFALGACNDEDQACTVTATLDSKVDIYSIRAGLKSGDNVSDMAGNQRDSDTVTVKSMDGVPPNIEAFNLEDFTDSNGIVTGGDTLRVYANVTDGVKVSQVDSNLTEFGLSYETMISEASASQDWNDDSSLDQEVYGVDVTVPESAEDGVDLSSWVTAEDNSSNSNTTSEFGSLEIDNTPPEVEIDNPLKQSPRYLQPGESLEINFTYTEKNPEDVNITVGPESRIFSSFTSGTDVDVNRTLDSSELPGEGEYDLNISMNDSAGLSGNDNESSSVFIDGTKPDNVSDLSHNDETAEPGYDDDQDANFTWTAASDAISGVDYYNVYISKDDGATYSSPVVTQDTNYTVDTINGDRVKLKVQAVDRSGNRGFNETSQTIKVDTVAPEASIYTPLAEDGIVNSSEQLDFKVNGTVTNDDSGEVQISVSDLGNTVSDTFTFSGGTFSGSLDVSGLDEGAITVEVTPTDQAGNTGSTVSKTPTKDTVAPSLDQGFKVNSTSFNASFLDDTTGLDPSTITAEAFSVDYGQINSVNSSSISTGENEENATVVLSDKIDSEELNFSITGSIRDVAGNIQDSGWVIIQNMDHVPPEVTEKNLTDFDGDDVVEEGEKVRVSAKVTDGTGVASVETNLSGFGDSLGSVSMTSEQASNYDWDQDGTLESNVYGTNATVQSSATSGVQSATATATDTSSNSNSNTTEQFGAVEVVKQPPQIDIKSPTGENPAYVRPTESLEVLFNYTEDDPDQLNITVGSQSQIFSDLTSGENTEASRTFSSSKMPSNGTYDLELNLTNTIGQKGNDSEASAVIVDGYSPSDLSIDVPVSKNYLQSSENFSVNYSYQEVNPDWTVVRLVNSSGQVGLKRNISESESNPDGGVKFTQLENLVGGVNYTVEVEVSDKVQRQASTSAENLLVVDNTAPVLNNSRKLGATDYRFDVYDEAGIEYSFDGSDFEIKEDISAVFSVGGCGDGNLNCTVDVSLDRQTDLDQLTAGLKSGSSISDLAGNTRNDGEVILEETDSIGPALESMKLNVSTPVNNSYSPGAVNITLGFNESLNTSKTPSIEINNLKTAYTASGDYLNSTHWSGEFQIKDEDEDRKAYVNITGVTDDYGNSIQLENDSDSFLVDTEEPEIVTLNEFTAQNLSDTVDLSTYFAENTGDGSIVNYEFNDGSGWIDIGIPTSWDSSEASSGEVDFRVNATDDTGNSDSLIVTSTVDNTPPVVEEAVIRIEDDAAEQGVLNEGDNFSVEVNATDDATMVETVKVNVSEVTTLQGFVELEEQPDGNFTGIFEINESATIESYSPAVRATDIESNSVETSTDNSVSVDSAPVEIEPTAIYTFLEQDKYENEIANPGDVINVSWNSTENGIDDIKNVTVDFGEFGGVKEASDTSGDGVYSTTLQISEGDSHGVTYSGNVTVNTVSGQSDTETDDDGVEINNDIPDAPTSLEASAVEGGAIDLSWDDVLTGDLNEYVVYRNDSSSYSEIGRTDSSVYTDNPPSEGVNYSYKVAAVDIALNQGPNSSNTSAVPDGTPPVVDSAVTYNTTAINVTLSDELNLVDASYVSFLDADAEGFDQDAEQISGLAIESSEFSTGDTPDLVLSTRDSLGNSRDLYGVSTEDGVPPEIKSLSMEDVAEDGEAKLSVTYTEGMETSVIPDAEFSEEASVKSSGSGTWVNSTTFSREYTFGNSDGVVAQVTVGNASDDSGNIQASSKSTDFKIDTVVPQPVVEGLSEGEVVSGTLLLNSSGDNKDDVENVVWVFEDQTGNNQTIAELSSIQNETEWSTPLSEFQTQLWLTYTDDVENSGTDSVSIEVDNVDPSIQGSLPDYISGSIDLASEIQIGEDAVSSSYEFNDGSEWTEVDNPSSWDSTQASEGSVDFRVNATDDAGNFRSKNYASEIDNTAPSDLSVESPAQDIFTQPGNLGIEYSYVEKNQNQTTIKLVEDGTVVLDKTVSETSENPDRSVDLETSGLESGNYSIEISALDKAGLQTDLQTAEIVHLDADRPVLVNGTYFNDTRMSFQVFDNETGLDSSTLEASDFEIITESVQASSFDILPCSQGSKRCTVNVSLEDPSYTAEFAIKDSETVVDRAGNAVDNTVQATDPYAEGPKADYSLNVSTPLNIDDADRTVGITINFSKPVNNSRRAYVDIQGGPDYDVSGSYDNETYWSGEFQVINRSQEENVTVHVSNVEDYDGNDIVRNDIGEFQIDLSSPELDISALGENLSGIINISDKLEASQDISSIDYRYGNETWNEIIDEEAWNTTEIDDGKTKVRLNASDDAGNTGTVEENVTIDNTLPEVNKAYINATEGAEEPLGLGDKLEVNINVSDNTTGIESVSINVSTVSEISAPVEVDEVVFSRTFTVNRSVDLEDYRPEIKIRDYAGNTVHASTNTLAVDSTTQDETGENEDSDSGSGSGGSSGGGSSGGGGFLPPDDTDEGNESGEGTENESEKNNGSGTLDPVGGVDIQLSPAEAQIQVEREASSSYTFELSVSEPAEVSISTEGLDSVASYSETFDVEASRDVQIPVSGQSAPGEYTGTVVASAGSKSTTSTLNVEILASESEETEVEVDVQNDSATYSSDVNKDIQGESTVETVIYDVRGNKVRTVENVQIINGEEYNGSISLEGISPGEYTLETTLKNGEQIYTGRKTFSIPEQEKETPYTLIATVMTLIAGLAVYVARHSGAGNKGSSFKTSGSGAQGFRRRESVSNTSEPSAVEDSSMEESTEDKLEKLDNMFEDEEIVQASEEASDRMSQGDLSGAEKKLAEVRDSDFLSRKGVEDIEDKIKKVHRHFERSIGN